jgi:hypothetical protein
MRSNSLIMACGEDLFNFWKLHSFVSDITETPEAVEYQQRIHELVTVKRPSIYFDMIDIIALKDTGGPETIRDVWGTIWDLASTFADHYCSDPRDRVFGLLALADSESREALSPDYTKSATSVLLQLMEHHAKVAKRNDSRHDARCALDIIGAFGSSLDNPDIAAMWDRRRSALHDDDPFSDIIATRGLGPLATRGSIHAHLVHCHGVWFLTWAQVMLSWTWNRIARHGRTMQVNSLYHYCGRRTRKEGSPNRYNTISRPGKEAHPTA